MIAEPQSSQFFYTTVAKIKAVKVLIKDRSSIPNTCGI